MARTTRVVSVSLSPDMAEIFENMAKSRRQGKSGLFRDMIEVFRRSEWLERYRKLQGYGARKARQVKAFTEKDIDRLVLHDR